MLLLLGLILNGCAAPKTEVARPDWIGIAAEMQQKRRPISTGRELPRLCAIDSLEGRWTPKCWGVLEQYEIIADGNTIIAKANAEALRNTEAAVDVLIRAGALEQQLTDFYADLLNEERQQRFLDGLINKGIIGAILIGVSL